MKRFALLIVLASAWPAAAQTVWRQEPAGFRGVQFGASEEELADTLGDAECDDLDNGLMTSLCVLQEPLGGVEVSEYFFFSDDQFEAVGLEYPSAGSAQVLEALTAKYGPPTARAGGMMRWDGAEVSMQFFGADSSSQTGRAVIYRNDLIDDDSLEDMLQAGLRN